MTLKLYDTLARAKREFTPIDPANVRMYVCGPTVYDFAHIGNARPIIVFDVLFRLLRHLYGPQHVTYVRNITDVDDKINERAARDFPGLPLNEAIAQVTQVTGDQFHQDIKALGVLEPSVEPRATKHIEEMREIIDRLVAGGFAYVAENHVLFSPEAMDKANGVLPRYGALANRSLDEMIAGARVDVAPYKRQPTDFVLWKPSKPGEPSWPSPSGIAVEGRPGWHIECSAMSWKHLGETFDIHGGGIDLVFPHHENEVAQSTCAFGHHAMANYWMHNGFLQVEGQKMSKSLGNFVTINELLTTDRFGGRSWPGEVLRLAMLKTHYRQPIDWTVSALEEAYEELQNWANALAATPAMNFSVGQRGLGRETRPSTEIAAALQDDLNTPLALVELRKLFSRLRDPNSDTAFQLMESCEFLGLLRSEKLFVFNRYHVGTGGTLISQELRLKLDALQVAFANNAAQQQRSLIDDLLQNGVKVSVQSNGAIGYEVIGESTGVTTSRIDLLIAARNAARAAKNFAEADRIRKELDAMGIALKDNKDGTSTWEVKR